MLLAESTPKCLANRAFAAAFLSDAGVVVVSDGGMQSWETEDLCLRGVDGEMG